ncbi:MAG: protein kinase domain-containing protein [Planctomycetota bacterium]
MQSDDVTSDSESESAFDDDAFLDDLFDRAVELASSGSFDSLRERAGSRPHLQAEVEDLFRTASEIAVGPRDSAPQLRGYSIVRELGRGASGHVWLALQGALGSRPVALKVLLPSFVASRRARQRFLREAHALARVRHDNVVPIYEVIERDEICAYAMEWVDGHSLAALIAHLRPSSGTESGGGAARVLRAKNFLAGAADSKLAFEAASWPQLVARIGIDVGRALTAVHEAGLVHRDVKPSNILLRRDGRAILSDLGLVRDAESSHHTLTGEFVGTLAFASPEVLRGEHASVDARSDVFSLGATLYQALVLELPFGSSGPSDVQSRAEAGAFEPLRKLDPKLPRDLETIVAKALDADPSRRYASAGDFADDLERLLALQPIRARRAGPIARTLKSVRRNARTFLGSVAGALVGVGVASYLGWAIYQNSQRPVRAAEHLKRAHYELIGSALATQGFLALNEEGFTHAFKIMAPPDKDFSFCERALVEYDHSLDLVPDQIVARVERDLIRSILTQAKVDPPWLEATDFTDFLTRSCPKLCQAIAESKRGELDSPRVAYILKDASYLDRKALGLVGFLCGSAKLTLNSWNELDLDLEHPSDALVDGLIGAVHLNSGRLELAYVRLVRALDRYPGSAMLTVLVADVALRLEDHDAARRFLARCDKSQLEPWDTTYERVAADLSWTEGRIDEAERAYLAMCRPGPAANPLAALRLAHIAEQRGQVDRAWRFHLGLAHGYSKWRDPVEGIDRCAERWWDGLSQLERERAIRAAARDGPDWPIAWKVHPTSPEARPATAEEMLDSGLLVPLLRWKRESDGCAPPLPDGPPFLWRFHAPHRSSNASVPASGSIRSLACTSEVVSSDALWHELPQAAREHVLLASYAIDRALTGNARLDHNPSTAVRRALGRIVREVLAPSFRR